jgi:cytochrome c oxidase subunit 2
MRVDRIALALAATALAGGTAAAVPVDGGLNFQPPVTEVAQNVYDFHQVVLWIIAAVTVFVLALLLWVILRYNRRANPTPRKFSHNTAIEIVWTVTPVLILVFIAYRSFPLLYEQEVFPAVAESEIVDIKTYGRQWYWSYIYGEGDDAIEFDSNMVLDEDLRPGQLRKLSVDNPVVVPAGKYVRLSVSASDVIHSWAMPQAMLKIDAIPGRLNQLWFRFDRPGVHYGQCSELCGTRHAYMPIELRVLPPEQYDVWLERMRDSTAAGRQYLDQVQPLGSPQLAAAETARSLPR